VLRYGQWVDADRRVIDEVTAAYMPEGQSYTGAEQFEVFCHGGRQVVRMILDTILRAGARAAEPGEFTRMAFLNGRIDLARAEAVAEVIAASTAHSYETSRQHLLGAYSHEIERLRTRLVKLLAEVEASIDFVEEDIEPESVKALGKPATEILADLKKLIATYGGGRIINEGYKIVLAGRPNAGKSSLFNLLLRQERALVNPTAGTTRDYLSEWIDLEGFAVNLIDTAGLRVEGDELERAGQSRARELIEIGVRAVVVAGWAVRDDAGEFFAETFYRALLHEQKTFGEAIRKARRKTHDEPRFIGCNTWGAYQAYGDPGFRMDPASRETPGGGVDAPVARVDFLESIRILTNELSQPEKEVRISLKHMENLLKQSPRAWLANPEVSYALARFVGSAGNFAEAIRYYQQAVETGDHLEEVPILAIQELANHEARQGEKMKDKALIQRAIKRLYALMEATDGPEAPEDVERGASNVERCGLMGSAYKRLAATLRHWSQPEDDPRIPNGIEQALTLSVEWYRIAEGRPGQPDFSPYLVQNRLAMQAVLGTAEAASAELARDAGKTARERYQSSRDFWDLIMVGDGELIAGIIDGSMSTRPAADDATQAVIDCYRQLQEQLPRNQREFDSVVTQVNLLKRFVEKRAVVDTNRERELGYLAANLGRIASALDPSVTADDDPSEKAAKAEVRAERGAKTKAIKKQLPKKKPKPTLKRKPPKVK